MGVQREVKDFCSLYGEELGEICGDVKEDEIYEVVRSYFMGLRRGISVERREMRVRYLGIWKYSNTMAVRKVLEEDISNGKIEWCKAEEVLGEVERVEESRKRKRAKKMEKAKAWFGEDYDVEKFMHSQIKRYNHYERDFEKK